MFLNPSIIYDTVVKAIYGRSVLAITYQHTSDGEVVHHKIAPFDIGTTNPRTYEQNKDKIYAYCFDHLERNNIPDPKVIAFNMNNFVSIQSSGETFDPIDLTDKNKQKTGYDYRNCNFAVAKGRNWY